MVDRGTPECQQSCVQLKEAVASGPVVSTPGCNRESTFFTDASSYGLGEVRCQADDLRSMSNLDISQKSLRSCLGSQMTDGGDRHL